MKFSDRTERKGFESRWAKLREEYRQAGMSEYAIEQLHAFDLNCFNRDRAATRWGQYFSDDVDVDGDEEVENTLLYKYVHQLSREDSYFSEGSRFSWIEQINDETLYNRLMVLSDSDKELLTLLAFDEYSKTEIVEIYGKTPCAICRKVERLGKYLFSA